MTKVRRWRGVCLSAWALVVLAALTACQPATDATGATAATWADSVQTFVQDFLRQVLAAAVT